MNFRNEPSVAIIIINWNGFALTKICIESLFKSTYNNYQVVLIDNASADGSGEQLNQYFKDRIDFIQNDENLGFTGGNNVGIKYALELGYDYIMELNNDTEVEPDFLMRLVKAIDGKKEFGAAQPLILYTAKPDTIWNGGGTYYRKTGLSITRAVNKKIKDKPNSGETDWITGCCFLIKSEVLKKTGCLKEVFFFGCFEDVDLSLRIQEAGYKLWMESSSVIYHSVGQSSISKDKGKEGYVNPQLHYLWNRNQLFFIRMHVHKVFLPVAYIFQLIKLGLISVYFLGRGRVEKLKLTWRGFYHGLTLKYEN